MKILVACEESQAVTIELRKLGHEAYSCDLEPCSGGHPEWHIQSDVIPLLNGDGRPLSEKRAWIHPLFMTSDNAFHSTPIRWDMIIAFPPCTYISNAGAKHLWKNHVLNEERYKKGLQAKGFFLAILNADCPKVAIENPISSKVFLMPKHSQEIQPYMFGVPTSKKTRLWLKGLPELEPTNIVEPICNCHESYTWFMKGGTDRQKNRAKTFPQVAAAMAEQWAGDCT